MRLDHLLSKEHWHRRSPGGWVGGVQAPVRTECVRRLAHGWNIDSAVGIGFSGLVRRFRVLGTGRGVGVGWCTLLGPEGPGFRVAMVVAVRGWAGDGPSFGLIRADGFVGGGLVPIVC